MHCSGGTSGAPGQRDLRQRSARHGTAGPVGAVHGPGVCPRRAQGLRPSCRATCGCRVQNTRCCACRACGPRRPRASAGRDGGRSTRASTPRPRREAGMPRRRSRHGRRGPRPRRDVPVPRAVRPRPRLRRADRHRRARARASPSAIARAYNDWLARLLRRGPERMFGAGDGRAPRHRGRGARGPAVRGGARVQGGLPVARHASTVGPGTTRPTTRCGPRSSGSTCPIAFHGGGQTYLTPDFWLEVLDKLMLWHTFSQPLGIQFVHGLPLRWRRARAVPRPAGRRCWRATARGRRGCSTGSTSTASGPAGTRRPT